MNFFSPPCGPATSSFNGLHVKSKFLAVLATMMGALVWGREAPLPDLTKGTSGVDRSLTCPYEEHEPWYSHENNGKSAMCAALFGVQADRIKETRYFTRMCVAAYPNTEVGHTGQGFSYLWRMVGANLGGPLAAAAFFKEMSWHFDLMLLSAGSTPTMAKDPRK